MKNKELTTIAWYWLKGAAIGSAVVVVMIMVPEYVK